MINSFRERLKYARTKKQYSQQELADKSGVSQSTIGSYESGERCSSRNIAQIAAVLGVSPYWLETGKGEENPALPVGRILTATEEEWLELLTFLGTDDITEFKTLIRERQSRNERLLLEMGKKV